MTKVMIVGDYLEEAAERKGRSFAGPSEGLLMGLLRQVGIAKEEVFLTNAIQLRPRGNRFETFCGPKSEAAYPAARPLVPGKYIHARYLPELERLDAEIARHNPNVILALGNVALWALTRKSGIKKYRGSPLPSLSGHKVIPSWPLTTVFRQWNLRVILLADLQKAKTEKEFPEIDRPQHFIYMRPDLDDIASFYYDKLVGQPFLSCDIETKMGTITEVGYGTADAKHCLVIPFWDREQRDGNYWRTQEEELAAWQWCRRLNEEFHLIGQNFSYDMQYFWRTVGIPCPHFLGDTMLQHHSLQPEMEKGLGFLGSIYTNEPSWKFMRQDHSTLKRGDD